MSGYHSGERAVQERAGLLRQAEFSSGGIRDAVPDVAVEFLAGQPLIVVGGTDAEGRMWATQLVGQPGFIGVPDPRTVSIGALPAPDDPLHGLLAGATSAAPARVGMIAIEPATRRRMRVNGRAVRDGTTLRVDIDQVIANCPKYIQKRDWRAPSDPPFPGSGSRKATAGTALSPAQQSALAAADTFFVATASGRGDADASHRGGNPGFVRVLSPGLLRWPDYTGNAMFLTLGNLTQNPAAGILVPDWGTGATLHLSGTARTIWDPREVAQFPGAQRLVEFSVAAVREVPAASGLRWTAPIPSRFNPPAA
jgi:predicted pyridoxine 5'-phosphate oxidase superfamily flavin-nucleotide-binding protein